MSTDVSAVGGTDEPASFLLADKNHSVTGPRLTTSLVALPSETRVVQFVSLFLTSFLAALK